MGGHSETVVLDVAPAAVVSVVDNAAAPAVVDTR